MAFVRTRGEKIFNAFNSFFMIVIACIMLYPFISVLTISLSTPAEATRLSLHLYPKEPTFSAYLEIFKNPLLLSSFGNTVLRTLLGTAVNVALSVTLAYPLSKKYLPHRSIFTSIIIFTMFFSGGMIPSYLLIRSLNMINTIFALILPTAINTFNMIIVRNYFMSLPASLEESARIDGANDLIILFRIYLPVSVPITATVTLWYAVGHWNAWFDALIYMPKTDFMVLQLMLRKMLIDGNSELLGLPATMAANDAGFIPTPEVLKAATIVVSSLPIIMVYPFIQRYFMTGIMVGSLKG